MLLVLMLADILPTAYEVGVLNGMVSPGDLVAIVGAGPVGLAAILTAQLYTPAGSWRSTSRTADSKQRGGWPRVSFAQVGCRRSGQVSWSSLAGRRTV
jgi:threonine dehydrogenase-like Zn-dependent dehydrogenase